ncbi:hypothetical protein CCY99_03565 [Helicobacter sp. 16-1353]|uniref:TerB family tellurite resistance protein n=1 Tax=Helicobacter sp. 16-1353 TaxID=2004996 RepID=UPI000DCE6B57|nr:TerB family tellurite resistance protein [Helicobacter sp. 16-1353]RAX54438.1 hypothetical protein CCY99_03565 [Helicobacter sp. 16-1353]
MFLNRLTNEEKIGFLELAHYIAESCNNFSQTQNDIIEKYLLEMQIGDIEFDKENFDIYDTLGKIKNKKSQKIVLMEILLLIYSDHFLHEEERKVLEKVREEFGLSYYLETIYVEWAKTVLSAYVQGYALIEI